MEIGNAVACTVADRYRGRWVPGLGPRAREPIDHNNTVADGCQG